MDFIPGGESNESWSKLRTYLQLPAAAAVPATAPVCGTTAPYSAPSTSASAAASPVAPPTDEDASSFTAVAAAGGGGGAVSGAGDIIASRSYPLGNDIGAER